VSEVDTNIRAADALDGAETILLVWAPTRRGRPQPPFRNRVDDGTSHRLDRQKPPGGHHYAAGVKSLPSPPGQWTGELTGGPRGVENRIGHLVEQLVFGSFD